MTDKTPKELAEDMAMRVAEALIPDSMDFMGNQKRENTLPYVLVLETIPLVELMEVVRTARRSPYEPENLHRQRIEYAIEKLDAKLKELATK